MFNWMDSIVKENNIQINHKLNYGSEKRVGPYLVDGYDPHNNVIYEFHGCYFHGDSPTTCPLTRKITSEKWLKKQPLLLRGTRDRTMFLKSKGYEVREIWECQYHYKYKYQISPGSKNLPPYCYKNKNKELSKEDICNAVNTGELFGMVECDIGVPESWPKGCEKTDESI